MPVPPSSRPRPAQRPANRISKSRRFGKSRRGPQGRRLLLEPLETRTLLSVVNWSNASGGDWDVAANWTDATTGTHHIPGIGDDAVINVGGGVTITHGQNATDLVNSITASNPLVFSAGTLSVTGSLSDTSSVRLAGGTLANATIA